MFITPEQMQELTKPFTNYDYRPITVHTMTNERIILQTYVEGSGPDYTPWRVVAGAVTTEFDTAEAAIVAARYELMLQISKTEDAFLPCSYRQENSELVEALDEAESEIAQLAFDLEEEKKMHNITKENFKNYIDECRVTYAGPSRKTIYTDTGKPVRRCECKPVVVDTPTDVFKPFAIILTVGIVLAALCG